MATEPPARAAATAWFAPLPPRAVKKVPPSTVSPGRGRVGTRTTMSVFELPTTTIRGWDAGVRDARVRMRNGLGRLEGKSPSEATGRRAGRYPSS